MRRIFTGLVASAIMALFAFFASASVAQLRFDTQPLAIVTASGVRHNFTVELALDSQQRQQGLMYRTEMAEDRGMLFDFGGARDVSMWMRNTLLPLDMLFIDAAGRVVNIHQGAVPLSEAIISSGGPVNYVLELKGGVVASRGIAIGDRVESAQIARGR
ncbi:hypothetical protein SAMN05880590_107203 [Rhizobium sp. RU35A]|uniref:DUF192 domain-containing protein n=1 Tax=Rhizobium sp. RU35A TaxID=1907414 RepID=UPI0009569F89|nr:DUF192 domain-containing protein [Rhizobium sp. RU35A]SIQ79291.1 hypothetical protein SAMN05880590_107203 [Rhizobium sp. RU35A]